MEYCIEMLFRPSHYLTSLSGRKKPEAFLSRYSPIAFSFNAHGSAEIRTAESASVGLQTGHVADVLAQKEPETNEKGDS
jgi:hypothetical protein